MMTTMLERLRWNTTKIRLKMMRKKRMKFLKSRRKSYRMQSKDSKKGKAADSNGIRAEDIKAYDEETKEMVRQIFNEVIKQKEYTPEAWR